MNIVTNAGSSQIVGGAFSTATTATRRFRSMGLALLVTLAPLAAIAESIEILVVGGGGGAANAGGGGGGIQYQSAFTIATGVDYPVVVGAGGAGAVDNLSTGRGANGSDSTFSTITAVGGGGGGNTGNSGNGAGANGGSGGGGGAFSSGTPAGGSGSQGYAGGTNGGYLGSPYPGGGGGGGGAVGGNATSSSVAGNGGAGFASSITGSSVSYGGGGGGATYLSGTPGTGGAGGGGNGVNGANGQNGAANTGGGGGGATSSYTGGNGGSGVVIIRYAGSVRATGGTITTSGGDTIHTFTSNGTFNMSSVSTGPIDEEVDILAIGGGGGGSSAGGGAGGVQAMNAVSLQVGVEYPVVVGAGGAGAVDNLTTGRGANGGNSTISSITAIGGGGGGNTGTSGNGAGANGGSGGGGGAFTSGTPAAGTGSQGYAGGTNGGFIGAPYPGGGGGGGGGAGGNATSNSVAGNGGAGYVSSISGSSVTYAGGGGGATWGSGTPGTGGTGGGGNGVNGGNGQNGTANTGGGGGGASDGYTGGTGGSGVVIVRYAGAVRATGGTITSAGGDTIHTFTSDGTFVILGEPQSLPYITGFESTDGYTTGTVHEQNGWVVVDGSADVTTTDYSEGSRSLALQPGTAAAWVALGFAVSGSPAITFLDFDAKPLVGATVNDSSLFGSESARVGFDLSGGQGEIHVFDGVGANQWEPTGYLFPVNGSSQAADWLRLTLRLDYTAKKWDLYANGSLIDYDRAFTNNNETHFRQLVLRGRAGAKTSIDMIAAGAVNPLFTDADLDGLREQQKGSGLTYCH
jgi:hypothetical protein